MATAPSTTATGSSFQIPGLGGIDTTSIQASLTTAAQAPANQLTGEQAVVTQKQTAWRTINSSVLALGNAATALSDPSLGNNLTASVDDTSILTATATTGQSLGNYTVTVKALAQNQQMISNGYAASDSVLGPGTVSLQVGTASFPPLTFDASNDTLAGVAKVINSSKVGVTASIVDTGAEQGNSRYKLMLVSNTSGTAGAITATMNFATSTPTFTTTENAQDAHILMGTGTTAVDIYNSSNTISSVIPGVTLQLKSMSDTPAHVTLSQNTSAISSAVQGLMTQYNTLNAGISAQTSYDASTNSPGGPLFGSPTLEGLQQQVSRLATGSHSVGGAYSSLTDIGISADATGNLSITDQNAFNAAVTNNPTDVINLFQDPKQGIATQLNAMVTSYTDPTQGILTQQDQSFTTQYNNFQTQITTDNKIATDEQTRIAAMFAALQTTLAGINAQSQYVNAQIAAMNNTSTTTTSTSPSTPTVA